MADNECNSESGRCDSEGCPKEYSADDRKSDSDYDRKKRADTGTLNEVGKLLGAFFGWFGG